MAKLQWSKTKRVHHFAISNSVKDTTSLRILAKSIEAIRNRYSIIVDFAYHFQARRSYNIFMDYLEIPVNISVTFQMGYDILFVTYSCL